MQNVLKKIAPLSFLFFFLSGCGLFNSFYVDSYQPERDREFIINLFKDDWYWLISEDSPDFSPEHMLDTRSSSQDPENLGNLTIKVGLEGKNPIGFVSYYLKEPGHGWLLFLSVNNRYRGKGYAQKLMLHALNEMASKGMKVIDLLTRINNYPAQSIYKKLGFREIWRDEGFIVFRRYHG